MYCNPSCLWVCLFVGRSVTTITRNWGCIDPHQTRFVDKGSDRLQLIKFFAIPHPRERGLWRGRNFWLRLTTASVQCSRLSERFFHIDHAIHLVISYRLCRLVSCTSISRSWDQIMLWAVVFIIKATVIYSLQCLGQLSLLSFVGW